MKVSAPTIVLLAVTAPLISSQSALPTNGKGQPWSANIASFGNYSQFGFSARYNSGGDVTSPIFSQNDTNIINLDLSNTTINFEEALEGVLGPKLANIQMSDKQQTISTTLNITPPPDANMDFVNVLKEAVWGATSKLIPFAGTSLGIAFMKSPEGALTNVKVHLNIVIPAAVEEVIQLTSNAAEIDLTDNFSNLEQSLRKIVLRELSSGGYNPHLTSIQNFSFSFSILPPYGATRDYVRLNIIRPLQKVLRNITEEAHLTSVSVKTEESKGEILRMNIDVNIRIVPSMDFQMGENVVEVPEVNLNVGNRMVSTVVTTLQNQININANVSTTQARTISIRFKISAGTTQKQIQELYITPISLELSKLDPTGKIFKIGQKTLPNGEIIIFINMNIPANTTIKNMDNGPIQVVTSAPPISTSVEPEVERSSEKQENVNLNRNTLSDSFEPAIGRSSGMVGSAMNITNENLLPEDKNLSETTKTGETEAPLPEVDVKPSNPSLSPPINIKDTNIETIVGDIQKRINEVYESKSSQHLIGIPIIMPKKNIFMEMFLQEALGMITKGKILPKTQTNNLPDGQIEYIIFFEKPEKNDESGTDVEEKIKPEIPQTLNATQLANSIVTSPIDLRTANPETLMDNIRRNIDEVSEKNKEKGIIGIPFIMSKNNPHITSSLRESLKMGVPGTLMPETQTKELPNGNIEYIVFFEKPAIMMNEPFPEVVENQTEPSIENKEGEIVTPETSESPEEVQPPTILVSPTAANSETLLDDIRKKIDGVREANNSQPQVIGVPFNMPMNNVFIELALKKALGTVSSGKILQETETKKLPNGEIEYIIFLEKKTTMKNKPTGQGENQNDREKFSTVIPEGSINTLPIDIHQLNSNNLRDTVEHRINQVKNDNNGQVEVVGIPFVLPKSSYIMQLAIKEALEAILPGEIFQHPQTKILPNGKSQILFFYKLPKVKTVATKVEKNQPEVVEDVYLDKAASVRGEISKALIRAISTISANPKNLKKPAYLKFNIRLPKCKNLSKTMRINDAVSSELKDLEPDAEITSAKVNLKPAKTEPDGVVEILIPFISSSKILRTIKNTIEIPLIDAKASKSNLLVTIREYVEQGLKSVDHLDPKGLYLFQFKFRLNPRNTKISTFLILKAIQKVDPKGSIVSQEVTTGPDGLYYLEVRYLIPKLGYSILNKMAKPRVSYESGVIIDTMDPMHALLKRVNSVVRVAEASLAGTPKGQIVDLPLNFRFSNPKRVSKAEVDLVIRQMVSYIRSSLSRIMPEGKVISVSTFRIPFSTDVMLRMKVRTPYQPDRKIVIQEGAHMVHQPKRLYHVLI